MLRTRPSEARAVAAAVAAVLLAMSDPSVRAEDPGAPSAGGAIRISPEPPRLVLGRDASAELRIAASPEVEDLQLSASAGRIEGLRRVPGGFAARYRAPAERFPQVAILSALARTPHGSEDGWVAIPLSGQGDARVHASPGQEITLQIGDRSFGPRRAGADGLAVIPVVVPPGVREAHHGFKPIDLHVPESPLLHAVLDRGVVLADRPERVKVLAYVVAPHGAARRGDVPVFEASRGTVAVQEREAGAVEATWTLPPGRAGEERLAVRVQAAPALRTVLKVETVAGPPALVAVSFDREVLVADVGGSAVVTARALDAAGNPVPARLSLAAEGGELADPKVGDLGEVEARVEVGTHFGGRTEVRVTAESEGTGISGSRTLPLRAGEPALARFEAPDAILRGDGSRAARLRVSVADRHGNPVGVAPAVTAALGKVLGVEASSPGGFDVRYLAPAVARATRERLVASVGAAKAIAGPLLLGPAAALAVVPAAGFAVDVRGRFTGPRAGLALERPANLDPLLERGVDLAWRGEVEALRLGDRGAGAMLGGVTLYRPLPARAKVRASLTAGVLLGGGEVAPAARLAFAAGAPPGPLAPFVEVALLAARRGQPGAFAAATLNLGVEVGLERRHGDDPDRR
jgi:hypothetical protein